MKIREVIVESISPAQSCIDQVYSRYPEWPYGQADRVMVWGSGEEQTFAAFKLKPGADARTVEIDWIMAGPEQRQGVGSRAIRELQRQAQESNIRLTLYPWSHGRISSASLTRLYKRHGFKPIARGAKPMTWEPIQEGGWDSIKTQGTVLHPRIVAVALKVVDRFVAEFNAKYAAQVGQIRRGRPTGSSAYHEQDTIEDPEKVYGDIDLQMIAPEAAGQGYTQFTTYWNKLADDFINTGLSYVEVGEKPGHPTFQIGANDFVQIDFMWHPERLEKWGAARVTPERGVKGLLTGNMFSVLGELLDLSIQHAGVQLKVVDGQHVPFSKQKGTEVVTVTTEPATFILDTFVYQAKQLGIDNPKIDPMLKQFPGNDINNVKISRLVNGVKGFAKSCESNGMFGQGDFANFADAQDFINRFWQRYEEKAQIDIAGKKRDKASTPAAVARANSDREKIQQGLDMVKGYFQ